MSEIDDVSATIKRMMSQSFEDGYQQGRGALLRSFDEGRQQGQQDVYAAVLATLDKVRLMLPSEPPVSADVPEIQPEPGEPEPGELAAEDAAATQELPPFKLRALDYVNANPGTTAVQIGRAVGGSTATVYKLQREGLVTKIGAQFYPVEMTGQQGAQ